MKLLLSDGTYAFFEQNNVKLQLINGKTFLVGNTTLYGVTEHGERVRLYASISDTSDLYTLDYYEYNGTRWTWTNSNVTIEWSSVPPSMKADDTYNFDNFNPSLILTIFLSIFVIFCVFKRR